MKDSSPAKQRSKCRIIADILKILEGNDEVKVTHIIHSANIPYERLNKYLAQMSESGLILESKTGNSLYSLTPKGKKYLAEFKKLEEFSSIFGVDI
jgi:predicted transcriptional regulator